MLFFSGILSVPPLPKTQLTNTCEVLLYEYQVHSKLATSKVVAGFLRRMLPARHARVGGP